jgi:Icc protein
MKTYKGVVVILLFIPFFISCDKFFEYSPYSATVPEKMENTTAGNLDEIKELELDQPSLSKFKIAFISDNHLNFNDLDDAVDAINQDDEVLFTIHCGDMTDGGMLAEYIIYRNVVEKLHHPYLTVIGNHDCLANGEIIYQSMFGKENYTLQFQGNKFIFFNDVIWELNDREPDFLWLQNELSDHDSYHHVSVSYTHLTLPTIYSV